MDIINGLCDQVPRLFRRGEQPKLSISIRSDYGNHAGPSHSTFATMSLLRVLRRKAPAVGILRLSRHGSVRSYSGRDTFFQTSEEVREAVETGKPVVALETTIYTHGKQT